LVNYAQTINCCAAHLLIAYYSAMVQLVGNLFLIYAVTTQLISGDPVMIYVPKDGESQVPPDDAPEPHN
jgi:hypothetical protein